MSPELARAATADVGESTRATEIIDCDVHPVLADGMETLFPYMSAGWRERLRNRPLVQGVGFDGGLNHPGSFLKRDATPPAGGLPGSDPEFVRSDLLDRMGIDRAMLMPFPANLNAWSDADEADVIAAAYNEYYAAEWLTVDDRFQLAMVASPHDPVKTARHIRDFGAANGVASIFMPVRNTLMGNRHYWPIYEAAEEMKLPLMYHGTGAEGLYQGAPTLAGGIPASYTERFCTVVQVVETNLVSMVFEGAFERFPGLRVAFVESGWAWLPHILWRMDTAWQGLRHERPWVKRPPTEYVRDHVRVTTQPFYEPPKAEHVDAILEMIDAEHIMLFSTDYPHWDGDDPDQLLRRFSRYADEFTARVFSGNAREFFPRLTPLDA